MKLALVHDFLVQDGGAEKVLAVLQDVWPDAPTYTLFFDPQKLPLFANRDIRTSFLQQMPLILKKYQWYITLMPTATEQYNLSDFDVVVSSTSAFAKGIITRPDATHICYCHTPTRYLWSDTHSYLEELRVPKFIKSMLPPVLSRLRLWDAQAAHRVDHFIANSNTVKTRIQKYYHRDAHVIFPPVNTHRFHLSPRPKNYFLTGGRLVAYKRFDLIIDACNKTGIPLKVFGSGPVEQHLKREGKSNIEFLGKVSDERLQNLYADAIAFIQTQEEDFGITTIESMASGRPVIAYRKGGAIETIMEGVTGEFLESQTWEELADRLIRFNEAGYDPKHIKAYAQRFSRERFKQNMENFIKQTCTSS